MIMKTKFNLKLLLISVIFFNVLSLKAQDIHFSQYNEAPLWVNPALTGYYSGDHRLGLNYKNQWKGFSNAYNTYALSYDANITTGRSRKNGYLSLGVAIFNDAAGDVSLNLLNVNLNIAYHLKLNQEHALSAGIYTGLGVRWINQAKFEWGSQYDGTSGFDQNISSNEHLDYQSRAYPDFGFGLNWSMLKDASFLTANNGVIANAGIAVHHLSRPSVSYMTTGNNRLNIRYTGHARVLIGLRETKAALIPTMIINFQGKHKELLAGMMVRYTLKQKSKYTGFVNDVFISLGGHYRLGDALIIQIGGEMSNITLNLSYDINTSSLTKISKGRGGFEISMGYIIGKPKQNYSFY